METKELMIGNYVLRHTGEITKVLEVLTSMVRIKAEGYNSIKSITIPSRSISPIILTEEHLLKLGFETLVDKFFFCGFSYIKKRGKKFYGGKVLLTYVHELQNYYYLHTKEHLYYDFTK